MGSVFNRFDLSSIFRGEGELETRLKNQRVFVTGGAGYIGSHLCKRLAQLGAKPIVFDNFSRGFSSNVRWGAAHIGDVREPSQILKALRYSEATMVVHLAGLANARESVEKPDLYASVNRDGTLGLLEALTDYMKIPLIYSSSCSVYGSAQGKITEDSPTLPESPYGQTKLQGELAVKDWTSRTGNQALVLRYFNVAGADPEALDIYDYNEQSRIFSKFVKSALFDSEPVLKINGDTFETKDGTCVRDYVHVSDVVEAHVRALSEFGQDEPFSILNISSGSGLSNLEIAEAVQVMSGKDVRVEIGKSCPGDPASAIGAPEKAREKLDWSLACSDLNHIIGSLLQKYGHEQGMRPADFQ